jgi:hypothetical protein
MRIPQDGEHLEQAGNGKNQGDSWELKDKLKRDQETLAKEYQ